MNTLEIKCEDLINECRQLNIGIPIKTGEIRKFTPYLKSGDKVLLSGCVLTARDAAHKKIENAYLNNQEKSLKFSLAESVIYYAGPTQTPEHLPIGSCGPTTSSRMNKYSHLMLSQGVSAFIGKGERDENTINLLKQFNGVYFVALGGAGALATKHIKNCRVVDFEDLGCESVKELEIENFPLYVAYDYFGGDIFNS